MRLLRKIVGGICQMLSSEVKCFGSLQEANEFAATHEGWLIVGTQVFQHPYTDKKGKVQVCITQVYATFIKLRS